MTRRVFAAALLLIPAARAVGKPDFSGEWKLNPGKSDFGPIPPPSSQTQTVDYNDPLLKVLTKQSAADGDSTTDATYSTDGKETHYDYRGTPVAATSHWDGDTLVIDSKVEAIGATIKAAWKLGEDGKTMTIHTKISTAQGEFEIHSLFEKQ